MTNGINVIPKVQQASIILEIVIIYEEFITLP